MDNNNYPISREDAIKQVLNAISSYSEGLPETGYSAVGTVSDTDTGCTIDIKLTPSGKPVGSVQLTFTEDNNLHTMIVEGYNDKTDSNPIQFPMRNSVLDFTTEKYTGAPFSFFLKMTVTAFIYLKTFAEKVCKLADAAYHMGSRYEIPEVTKGRAHTVITLYNNLGANSKATQLKATTQKTTGVGGVETYAYRSISIQYRYGDRKFIVGVTDTTDDINSVKTLAEINYDADALREIFDQSAETDVSRAIETVASGNRISVDMISAMDETGQEVRNSKLSGTFSHYKQYSSKVSKLVANAINRSHIGVYASDDLTSDANLLVTCSEQHESKSGEPLYVCQILNKEHTPVMTVLIKDSNLHDNSAICDIQWANNMRHNVIIKPDIQLPGDITETIRRYAKIKPAMTGDRFTRNERKQMRMNGIEDDIIIPDDDNDVENDTTPNEFTSNDMVAKAFGDTLERYFNARKGHAPGGDETVQVEIHDEPIGNGEYRLYSVDDGGNKVSLGIIKGGYDSNNKRIVKYVYPKSGKVIEMAFSPAENMMPTNGIIRQLLALQPKLKTPNTVYKFNHNAYEPEPLSKQQDVKTGIPLFDEDI